MRKPITLADFLLPLTKEEDELPISNSNQISRVGCLPPSDLEDSEDEIWVPPIMPPPMDDDDYQDNDQKSNPKEEEYHLDEILNENDFIIDRFFYQGNVLKIEV